MHSLTGIKSGTERASFDIFQLLSRETPLAPSTQKGFAFRMRMDNDRVEGLMMRMTLRTNEFPRGN